MTTPKQQRRLKVVTCLLWLITAASCLVILAHRTTLLRIWRSKSMQVVFPYSTDAGALIPVSDAADQQHAVIEMAVAQTHASLRRARDDPARQEDLEAAVPEEEEQEEDTTLEVSSAKCTSPTCGKGGFCLGYEADNKVYCYGSSTGCMWTSKDRNSRDCTTDQDCKRYSSSSPKFTDGDQPACDSANTPGGWRAAACGCDQAPAANKPLKALRSPAPAPEEEEEEDPPDSAPAAAARRPAAASANPVAARQGYGAKYGFYIHAYDAPAAVIHQVRQIKKHFPVSPIHVMSDGGRDFGAYCKAENCTFVLCPPANDRWHPWPFFRRIYDAAVKLNSEYVIMLEPDNTIHGPITRPPNADAGGLRVKNRRFRFKEFAEKQAPQKGFKWTVEMEEAGLCGGSYFSTTAILDAFSDESVARFDWNYLGEAATKEMFSSDFAMPYLLAARGYEAKPWDDAAQMEQSPTVPYSGKADAAIKHYGGGYPGGKPTYNLRLAPEDEKYLKWPPSGWGRWNSNCQVCYSLEKYIEHFGTDKCTNKLPFKYSAELRKRYPGR